MSMAKWNEPWECDCGEVITSDEELEKHENECLVVWGVIDK